MTTFPFYPPDRASAVERYSIEYKFDQMDPTPWTPLRTELSHARLALVSTAGAREKSQPPFKAGAAEPRIWPITTPRADLAWDDATVEMQEAEKDINVLIPLDRLVELRERRSVGELYENVVSFFSAPDDERALLHEADQVGRRLRDGGVHAVLLVPATQACNQTVCLIARGIERQGISTLTLVSIREVAEQVLPPRGAFLNFPFGCALGRAHATPLQQSIMQDLIQVLRSADRPGQVVPLPYRWEPHA